MSTFKFVGYYSVVTKLPLIGLTLLVSCASGLSQLPPCSEAKVQTYSPTPDRARHLVISTDVKAIFDSEKKVVSELGPNRWFVTVDPVYTKNPPWNTTILVGDVGEDKPFLRISILDHGNTLNVRWITERLLLVNIWWGRFGMSDWIFDIEKHKIVYDELNNYYETYDCIETPVKKNKLPHAKKRSSNSSASADPPVR